MLAAIGLLAPIEHCLLMQKLVPSQPRHEQPPSAPLSAVDASAGYLWSLDMVCWKAGLG